MSHAELQDLISRPDFSDDDKKLVKKAYEFAQHAHESQQRYSGEPYFNHVLATALILDNLGMDANTVSAGLLHDVIEDTDITELDVKLEFGSEVLFLVNGVTKLGNVRFRGSDRHIESLRKLFVATSEDVRVLIIKLADRLHNMRTLEYVPVDKQQRIAKETMEVYAPVAHRLNMGQVKGELEDLSFKYLHPADYQNTMEIAKDYYAKSEGSLKKIESKLTSELKKNDIKFISMDYRRKHLWSLYQKLERKDMDIERVYDISALRVIVAKPTECYQVLGIVHSIWRPLPGRIKDYIAFPKPNGYQSVHTTIFTGAGNLAEVQIRTANMHSEAEFGIASHYVYKKSNEDSSWSSDLINLLLRVSGKNKNTTTPDWIQEIAESQKSENLQSNQQFMSELRDDFFTSRIFAFTPNGDVIDLPSGATPIDFAYYIHTNIGDHISGAKINGKLSNLGTELRNGDIVEIITSKKSKPSQKWLSMTATSFAKRRIRNSLQKEDQTEKLDNP
jgi:GTP pyrophosphokinase